MIRIVTIEREYGAGGAAIAELLAERLGWTLWDQALTAEIARLAHVDQDCVQRMDERCDSRFYRLMKVFMRGSYERSLPVAGMENFDADCMVEFMQRVMSQAAGDGKAVIVGRGAPYFLREREDAFHVFVYAPLEEKIRRVVEMGKTEEEALELINTVDEERATFIQRYFGKVWPVRHLYHMMLNTKVGDEVVVRTILDEVLYLDAQSGAARVTQDSSRKNLLTEI